MNIKIVDLAWSGSLFEPSSDSLLERLEHLAGDNSSEFTVILRAAADCHDYSMSWLHFVRSEGIWTDLFHRISRWHTLVAKIISSSNKWFFIGCGDIVGSWWELALACRGRVSTNPYAKVGFPEFYIDMILLLVFWDSSLLRPIVQGLM